MASIRFLSFVTSNWMKDNTVTGGCYALTMAVQNHPSIHQDFVATVGRFCQLPSDLKVFFMDKQMPLFNGPTHFYSFLSDLIPYFPMYIDSNIVTSSTDFVASGIIIAAINHLQDENVYNDMKSRMVMVNLISECWLQYEKNFDSELYHNLVQQILIIIKHCIYCQTSNAIR